MTATPFSCVVVGEEALLIECTKVLRARGHSVVAVVSPSAELRSWAEREGLVAVALGRDLAERLAPLRFEYLFSIANLRMLPDAVLAQASKLPVNFHDGPLPRHAGLFATSWAIIEGDREHAVTWHVMNTEADKGDVLKQRSVELGPTDTVRDLDVACFDAGIESFSELVDELASGHAVRTPQDLALRTYHGKYDGLPRAGVASWQSPAHVLDAWVRATAFGRRRNEFGTVFVAVGEERLLAVHGAALTDDPSTAEPGTVVECSADAMTVATSDRNIRLTALHELSGERVDLVALVATLRRDHGGRFTELSDAAVAPLVEAGRAALRQERRWLKILRALEPVLPPRFGALTRGARPQGPVALPESLRGLADTSDQVALAAVLAFLRRLSRSGEQNVALPTAPTPAGLLLAAEVPFSGPPNLLDRTLPQLAEVVATDVVALRGRSPYRRDLVVRDGADATSAQTPLPVAIVLPDCDSGRCKRPLTVRIDAQGAVSFIAGAPMTGEQAHWLDERFELFVSAIAAQPEQPLRSISLLSAVEEQRLREWNSTAQDYPRERTTTQLVAEVARTTPAAAAVRFKEHSLSYAELDATANLLAQRLIDEGAAAGTLVGVYLERSVELVVSLLAVMKTGAAYVPIDPIYPPARIGHMLEDSGARWVVTDNALAATLADFAVTPVVVERCESLGTTPVASVDRSDPDAPAYVIYTSGSTGRPKGVSVGHRALVNFLSTMAQRPGFSAEDSLLAVTTVCFDIAGLELYLPLVCGGTVEVLSADVVADGFALRERIEHAKPTVMQATPTTWQMLLTAGWPGDPSMRALCGGEALPAQLAADLLPRVGELHNMYGPTETTIWSTVDRVESGMGVTIGRPIGNTYCHVIDERGALVPPGIPGELYLSGDGVADGYLGRPTLTAERFVPAPSGEGRAYRTGDLVRYLPDGRLEYLERIDGQIKLNGYRIELGEVESALRKIKAVQDAVAIVREDQPGERRLIAYVTGASAPPEPAALRATVEQSLPSYMVPTSIVVLPKLPLTPNGKIDRKGLPKPTKGRIAGSGAAVRSDAERKIAEVWCEVLSLEWVGAEDNFFELGGDSLSLTATVAVLRERLGQPVTRLSMFGHPTVRAMAAHLFDDATPAATKRRARDVDALAQRRGRSRRGRRRSNPAKRL